MHIDCHVVSCEDSVEGFIGHITPTPASHFAAEFREVDSRPIPGAGNLFRARARLDFPEQLVGRSCCV